MAYGALKKAHIIVRGVLSSMIFRTHGKIVPSKPNSHEIDALIASFVLGLPCCEMALEQGRYVQACALLRQEMETIAQIKNTRQGKRKKKASPDVRVLEGSIRRLYDELSNTAHVSDHVVINEMVDWKVEGENLPGPTKGTRYFPMIDAGLVRRAFCLHLLLTINLIEELAVCLVEQYDDGVLEGEKKALSLAIQLMKAEGLVEPDDIP